MPLSESGEIINAANGADMGVRLETDATVSPQAQLVNRERLIASGGQPLARQAWSKAMLRL
jgi:hypothetical protein